MTQPTVAPQARQPTVAPQARQPTVAPQVRQPTVAPQARQPTVAEAIAAATASYAELPIFRAFEEDRIPLDRFPAFFREQAMATRLFQDLIWATTDIPDGPYAAFAREHRRVDSGHWKWCVRDLARAGLPAMTVDDHFMLEQLPTRVQMARILACLHDATPEERLVVLGALESAGTITLGAMHGYATRHGLAKKLLYLGDAHMAVEERQAHAVAEVAQDAFESRDPRLLALVGVVFDALGRMFVEGGHRYYRDILSA